MEFRIIDKKEDWNRFIIQNKSCFLQSFEWGEFQKRFSHKVWPAGIVEGGRIILASQIIRERLFPLGLSSYLYIPYGPVFDEGLSPEEREESFNLLLDKVKRIAEKEGALFLRIEPLDLLPKTTNLPFREAAKRHQPRKTLLLRLDEEEKNLLARMDIRTRYNINLAKRKGVAIEISDKYSHSFYQLIRRTSQRQDFLPYPEEHYKEMFKLESDSFKVRMVLARHSGRVIASGIFIFFGGVATSIHAGSDYRYRALKGMNLLHWRAICYAKEKGYKLYDFWGMDEKKYPGVTSFKKGFKGEEITYPAGLDIIFKRRGYQFYRAAKRIKGIFNWVLL